MNWTKQDAGTSANLNGIWGNGAWNAIPLGTSANLYGVWGSSGFDIYIVGEGGTILHAQ